MKTYCYDCGAKLEFSPRDKPKFCVKCGVSLVKGAVKQESPISLEIEEGEDAVNIPDISGLEVEFDNYSMKPKGEKLGSIMGTLDKPTSDNSLANNMPVMSSEEAMEQFRKEAGTIRQNTQKKDAQT